ncbi:MAG TPA: hypothetical protein PK466_05890 [Thermotogota bacterium]|nr:hypothetical protein [Thermotogota bacterium]
MDDLIGYHGTKSSNVSGILSENFKEPIVKKEDNHWLGHGIYFFSDFELAEWWAKTKVKIHNKKYSADDRASVIKAEIQADRIIDLDLPSKMNEFVEYCHKFQEEIVEQGIVLDFISDKKNSNTPEKISKRKRCFFMDSYKLDRDIEVILFTFSKENPSYASSRYHKRLFKELDLHYNEKQICVSKPSNIVKRVEIKFDFDDEVII